ncbi:hypothetical protein [Chryseobacterium sp. JK1]|uniref:hypothetical protein n=1 Tax=Chryseobacterium sp. JK1 TaxID=874294 RepID=UPI003D6865B5
MTAELSTYRKFIYKDDALELIKVLEHHQIIYELEDNSSRLGASFGGDANTNEFELKIQQEDFEKVEHLEEELVRNDVNQIEDNYYLFDYSDEELIEIVMKKEEWSKFDYLLAQKILKNRGKEVNSDLLNIINKQRIQNLAAQEKSPKLLIVMGYFFALLGGFIGIFIGYHLMKYRKVLPNGEKMYGFSENDRQQGQNILIFSVISFIVWTALRLFK